MQVAVSIIVPVYNVEKYLERCVNSLRKQTLENIEIILVDDGSTDGCPAMCESYAKQDTRIKVIHKTNEGLGFARNSGLEVALGEFVAFVDSDDYVEANIYEELYRQVSGERADVIISSGFITEKSDGKVIVNQDIQEKTLFQGNAHQFALEMVGALPDYPKDYMCEMSACKGLYCRELLNKHQIRFHSEREFISEDLVFHLDVFQVVEKAIAVPECYYHYCENGLSLTKMYQRDRYSRNVELYHYVLECFERRGYDALAKSYAERMLLARARVSIIHIAAFYSYGNSNIKKEILEVCDNRELRQLLDQYPIGKLPVKQRLFVLGMKYKLWRSIYLLSVLNSKFKYITYKKQNSQAE